MIEHITTDELLRFRRADLPPERVAVVARHLGECAACAAAARGAAVRAGEPESLRLALSGSPQHLQPETLGAYVDGTLATAVRAEAADHLCVCAMCRAEADDLAGYRRRIEARKPLARWWVPAIAAAVAVAAFVLRSPAPPPVPHHPRPRSVSSTAAPPVRAEWDALVANALDSGRIAPPAFFHDIRPVPDEQRGGGAAAPHAALRPSGVVVESDRPRFTWPANGKLAVVSIFDGAERAAQSEPLTAGEWVPPHALTRGRTYQWQVELRNGARSILPAPPDQPAAFHLMDEASFRELEAARSERPGDHLLFGVLYARAGARRQAATELAEYLRARPGDERARRLAGSIDRW